MGGDEKIAQFLRSVGQFRGFEQAVSRVLDRLAGVRLTNLRSLDQAYHLMEIPVDPQTGFERIQVHFWGDPGQKQKGFDAQNATVAIDVSMTALGDLWIVLAVGEAGRRCTIRAAEEAARNALASGRDDLCAALAKAGVRRSRRARHGMGQGPPARNRRDDAANHWDQRGSMTDQPRQIGKKAVALRYEAEKDAAPRVVAKGERLVAEQIIALAQEHGVQVYEDPDLVAVLAKLDVDTAIPEELYRAVAEVLAFVYRINQQLAAGPNPA